MQGNTVSGKANNVYLPSGKTLTIEIGMSTGASVGVTTENTSYPVAFSNAYAGNLADIAELLEAYRKKTGKAIVLPPW